MALLACGSGADTTEGGGGSHSGGGGTNTGGSSSNTGGGELCGTEVCEMGEGCDDIGPNCEPLTTEATCRSVPLDCIYEEDVWEPVCTCDGNIRPFNCGYFSSTSLDYCERIECGAETCDKATEYCEVTITAPYSADHVCKPLPRTCGSAPSCACMTSEPCAQGCKGTAESGFRLVCTLPM